MERALKARFTEWPPWALDVLSENKTVLGGVMADIFDALSHSLNYKFIVQSQVDHQFGSIQANGSFSGMLGALQKKEVDIVGPLAASEQRASVADFTNCLEFSKLGIITGIVSADRNMFMYVRVFSWQVWLSLLTGILVIVLVALLIYNASLNGKTDYRIQVVLRYFWIFWSNLIGHDAGSTKHFAIVNIWNSHSFRVLLSSWLLGPAICFLFTFQGSITSTFAVKKLVPIISDLDELALKTQVIPVISRGSAVQICFMTSKDYETIWKRMKDNTIVFSKEAVEDTLMKVEKGTHVLIVDYVYAIYISTEWVKKNGRCLLQVEELLFCQNFIALGLSKDVPSNVKKKINAKLTTIVQAKIQDRVMKRVFTNYTHCTKQTSNDSKSLDMDDIFGGLLFWCVGIFVSFLALIIEIFKHSRT